MIRIIDRFDDNKTAKYECAACDIHIVDRHKYGNNRKYYWYFISFKNEFYSYY